MEQNYIFSHLKNCKSIVTEVICLKLTLQTIEFYFSGEQDFFLSADFLLAVPFMNPHKQTVCRVEGCQGIDKVKLSTEAVTFDSNT